MPGIKRECYCCRQLRVCKKVRYTLHHWDHREEDFCKHCRDSELATVVQGAATDTALRILAKALGKISAKQDEIEARLFGKKKS